MAGARDPGQERSAASAIGRGLFLVAGALGLTSCTYDVLLGSLTTYRFSALACGTWDSAGNHTTGEYFVGHSTARPNDTISYFLFDLSPLESRTLVAASLVVPGTSDWKITLDEPGTSSLLLKLGATPLPAGMSLTQVTSAGNDPTVYASVRAEQDLGFTWVSSGSTTNTYEAFHYDAPRLQAAATAGGVYPLFAVERFGGTSTAEQYLYGGSTCGPDIVLVVDTE